MSYIHHIFTEIFWLYVLFSIIIIEICQCSIWWVLLLSADFYNMLQNTTHLMMHDYWPKVSFSFSMLLLNPHSLHLNTIVLLLSSCGNISDPQQAHFMRFSFIIM